MISQRVRENRRIKALKLTKNVERLYKESKCRDCAVVVTRMDFAKILGKFTKVKIQYESNTTPKTKKIVEAPSPPLNTRLKSNENGMVLIHRNAYNQHPVRDLIPKKPKTVKPSTPRQTSNILKENNRLKKNPVIKDKNSNLHITSCNEATKVKSDSNSKEYGIVFVDPTSNNNKNDVKNKFTLIDLVPSINESILPSDDWCIDYYPRNEEPKNDKVYDRIAAELEDLMYNEKPSVKLEEKSGSNLQPEVCKENNQVTKVEEFPSIMDILNDNSSDSNKVNDQSTSVEFKTTLESSDVEAMLLGKSNDSKPLESTSMDVENSDMSNLIDDVAQLTAIQVSNPETSIKLPEPIVEEIENPQSPSILDEALQKGIEEHLPSLPEMKSPENEKIVVNGIVENTTAEGVKTTKKINIPLNITQLIFKKNVNGECVKSVSCPKNLRYKIELEGKNIMLLGAPLFISSIEDLKVLLQIVNETDLKNLYVCL